MSRKIDESETISGNNLVESTASPTVDTSVPTFVGIGGQRTGSTWLHTLLQAHPDIYVPERRKEVGYFATRYHNGPEWYATFFQTAIQAGHYGAVGEITSTYLYHPLAPERIAAFSSIKKLLVIIRNPVDRAYSNYGMAIRDYGFNGSFRKYLETNPDVIARGHYSQHLARFLHCFTRDQITLLIFEDAVQNVARTKQVLASALHVDAQRFPQESGMTRANASYRPRFPQIHGVAARLAHNMRRRDWDRQVNILRSLGIKRLLRKGGEPLPPMQDEDRIFLESIYRDEADKVGRLFSIEIENW